VVDRLRTDFRADLPDTAALLRDALASADWPQARHIVHRIKGLGGSLGWPELTRIATPLEQQLGALQDDPLHPPDRDLGGPLLAALDAALLDEDPA
jgi:HPt (histidine-containing phosphotransfer) domain-containing protein